MNLEFLKAMQNRIASTAIGASTARGMGPSGTSRAGREFLKGIELTNFSGVKTEEEFRGLLYDLTTSFIAVMPKGARHWGSCRKFLNIFLRGATYNHFLRIHYRLDAIEKWLEVLLDSHVAKGLKHDQELVAEKCPRWRTVKGLEPETSDRFQNVARKAANSKGVARVHLDLWYWRRESIVKAGALR